MATLAIAHLNATSPSLAEVMRVCQLRAGLSRVQGASDFVLGNPKAWLGTAYHAVLDRVVAMGPGSEVVDFVVERLWNEAIAEQAKRVCGHPLNHRFGSPATWPGYHLVRASVFARARELAAQEATVHFGTNGAERVNTRSSIGEIREHAFVACGGKLIGRPDVIRDREVIDYKSGAIVEHDGEVNAEVIKAAYVRQLQIYACLVKANLGWWPQRGRLLPFVGIGVEVALEPNDCEQAAIEAVALLDAYNERLITQEEPAALASPSPQTCKWCSFKLICPAFWKSVSPSWSGQLDGAVIEGAFDEAPRAVHNGAALALTVEAITGSENPQRRQIAPLELSIHAALTGLRSGDRVRIVGLRKRPDGSLVPGRRTIIARTSDLPAISVARELRDSH